MPADILWSGPDSGQTLILAHGAGAPMDTPWMSTVAGLLGERGIRVARFEFAYMAARRDGNRRPPPRAETLIEEYRAVLDGVGPAVAGGKSMGGRVASMLADHDERVEGVVCLGYPFHPPGKPEQLRTVHLETMETPTLICQGERDPFGGPDEVAEYPLSPAVTVRWFADGDHGLKPRKGITGLTELDHLTTAADAIAEFTASVRP
jgi:predicted alpha/beta-hydrolase family hydrolase